MRFVSLVTMLSFAACSSDDHVVFGPICTEVASQPFDSQALTPSGDSASSVLADLALVTADVRLVATSNNGYGSFNDTFHWAFEAAGEPRLATLNGETDPFSHAEFQCPVGDVLFIPATVTLTSDLGLALEGPGEVMLVAATGEQWFGLQLEGAPVDPGYTTDPQCAGEPGPVTRLGYGRSLGQSLSDQPGFDNVSGSFSATVESELGNCSRSVGAVQRL